MGDAGVARCPLPLLLLPLLLWLPLGVRTAPTAQQATQQPCDLVYCLATPPITTSYTHTRTEAHTGGRQRHTHTQRQRGEPVDGNGDGAGVASYHNVKSLGEQSSSSSRRLLFSPSMGRRRRRRRRVGRMNQHCAALSLSLSRL